MTLAAALAACSPPSPAANPPANASTVEQTGQSGLEQMPLTIRSATGTHHFTVEVARSPEQQQQGLMYRRSLAPDRGMLFPYAPEQNVAFWMRNTFIPLDLVFIRSDGTIGRIAENCVPESLDLIYSGEPVVAVLEIAGGQSARLGLMAGDKVDY